MRVVAMKPTPISAATAATKYLLLLAGRAFMNVNWLRQTATLKKPRTFGQKYLVPHPSLRRSSYKSGHAAEASGSPWAAGIYPADRKPVTVDGIRLPITPKDAYIRGTHLI